MRSTRRNERSSGRRCDCISASPPWLSLPRLDASVDEAGAAPGIVQAVEAVAVALELLLEPVVLHELVSEHVAGDHPAFARAILSLNAVDEDAKLSLRGHASPEGRVLDRETERRATGRGATDVAELREQLELVAAADDGHLTLDGGHRSSLLIHVSVLEPDLCYSALKAESPNTS